MEPPITSRAGSGGDAVLSVDQLKAILQEFEYVPKSPYAKDAGSAVNATAGQWPGRPKRRPSSWSFGPSSMGPSSWNTSGTSWYNDVAPKNTAASPLDDSSLMTSPGRSAEHPTLPSPKPSFPRGQGSQSGYRREVDAREIFRPYTVPQKHLVVPNLPSVWPPSHGRRGSRAGYSKRTSVTSVSAVEMAQQDQQDHQDQQQQHLQSEGANWSDAIPCSRSIPTPKEQVEKLTGELQKYGKRRITRQKYMITAFLISANFILIFSSWFWQKFYYVYMPFIALPLVLNSIMIASIIFFSLKNLLVTPEKTAPGEPESLVFVMPCYNETLEECTKSLDSLAAQTGLGAHKRAIMVICDGRVRGPGMPKTCADHLLEDVFAAPAAGRETIRAAYVAWDGQPMDVEVCRGVYKGLPYLCIVKAANQGKRDSLIVVRSFLHNFNRRHRRPAVIFSPGLFARMAGWLAVEAGMPSVDCLVGMDADTVFDRDCTAELVAESRRPRTVGVCGYVAVDFGRAGRLNPWALYQSAEYSVAQGLRRLHQSVATHKVSCLPGCCQLLRVCEETCGDGILLRQFGYCPAPTDGMLRQVRATASEDRNHVCLMLTTHPGAQTRQALRARAYTDVPRAWGVFLSQRRRWTLGATANDLLLVCAGGTQWWERILALANVLTWCLNVFVIASIGCMIVAFIHQPYWIILAFAGVMIIPMIYYLIMTIWLPRSALERVQYLLGLALFTVIGPFLNIAILLFAVYNMDSFGWGKTRMVVQEDKAVISSGETSADEKQVPAPAPTAAADAQLLEARAVDEGVTEDQGRQKRSYGHDGLSFDEEAQIPPLQIARDTPFSAIVTGQH